MSPHPISYSPLSSRGAVLLMTLWIAAPARASHPEKPFPLPSWLVLDAEYRVETTVIDPLDLSGTEVTQVSWTDQRLRLDLGLRYPKVGGVYVQLDLLDGVLFGDNGTYGQDPEPTNGLAIASKNGNNAGWALGLRPGADPVLYDSYIPVLRDIAPITVRHAWAEVYLPIGLIRAGRMPLSEGASIAAHDGGRHNRWGASRYPDTADRVLFATKLDALVDVAINGRQADLDPSPDNGVLFAVAFDWNVQDDIYVQDDDQYQLNVLLSWRRKHALWGGVRVRDFNLQATVVHKWSKRFNTSVFAFPFKFTGRFGPARINAQLSLVTGTTREIAEGLALLSGRTPADQALLQLGSHVMVEYTVGPVDLAVQFDYASGDPDPRSTTPATQFSFARDFNVGLLLFEHLMTFQTARAAAVGIESLRNLNATSFPLTEVDSQTRFQNAVAIFPQVTWNVLRDPQNHLHLRAGVLAAWAQAGVVDPVATTLAEDGNSIEDDAVNFHGGPPGSYYGTEFDLQLGWRYRHLFHWTVEGALFLPGDAVRDRNGDAVPAWLFQNRLTFIF